MNASERRAIIKGYYLNNPGTRPELRALIWATDASPAHQNNNA